MFRVLIVDDTKSVHTFVNCLLGRCTEIESVSVFNGAQALDLLSRESFDLILMDWEMPVLDGPSAVNLIRRKGVQTPILMMTTKNSPDEIRRMMEMGVAEYLMKPFTIDILFDRIEYASGKAMTYAG